MGFLEPIKNLTGLAECFGRSPRLRSCANLVIIGGCLDPDQASDRWCNY
jgi:sucrose synthase